MLGTQRPEGGLWSLRAPQGLRSKSRSKTDTPPPAQCPHQRGAAPAVALVGPQLRWEWGDREPTAEWERERCGGSCTGLEALHLQDAKHRKLASVERAGVCGEPCCHGARPGRGEEGGRGQGHSPRPPTYGKREAASLAGQGPGVSLLPPPSVLTPRAGLCSKLLASERVSRAGEGPCPWPKCWTLAASWGKVPGPATWVQMKGGIFKGTVPPGFP